MVVEMASDCTKKAEKILLPNGLQLCQEHPGWRRILRR